MKTENKEQQPEKQIKIFGFHYDDNSLPFCTVYRINNTSAKETTLIDINEALELRKEIKELKKHSKQPPVKLPDFAKDAIKKLQRFESCATDGQNVDLSREWLDTLTHLGLLDRIQRSPGRWQVTDKGETVLKTAASEEK